jgi:hypothetical protein
VGLGKKGIRGLQRDQGSSRRGGSSLRKTMELGKDYTPSEGRKGGHVSKREWKKQRKKKGVLTLTSTVDHKSRSYN